MKNNFEQLLKFIIENDDFLLVSHIKPDGDAAGSTFGFAAFLRANGKNAEILFPDEMPDKYQKLPVINYRKSMTYEDINHNYKFLVALDSARGDRVNLGSGQSLSGIKIPLINIDHHADNDIQKSLISYVNGNSAAASEIICEIFMELESQYGWKIPPIAANWLYLGITTDSGSFRFSNTTPHTLECGAYLLRSGANLEQVVNAAFFSKALNQQKFESDMVVNYLHTDFDGRYVWAYLPPELFERYNFDMRNGETVIELLREIDTTVIAALMYYKNQSLKVSLRSKDHQFPVGPIARKFGGGGHEMASGITIENLGAAEFCAQLKEDIGNLFNALQS